MTMQVAGRSMIEHEDSTPNWWRYLRAPVSGLALELCLGDSQLGLLSDGYEKYPIIDGIAVLSHSPATQQAIKAVLDRDYGAALLDLLTEQDRFSPTAPPRKALVQVLLDFLPELTLREAMNLLNYGPVATYFAHRWTAPSFGSGLELLRRGLYPSQRVVEVACGIGHFLKTLEGWHHESYGVDVVFSKLYLARHFLGVRGPLVVCDIERFNPFVDSFHAACFCHDAFYFFEHKQRALEHMRSLSTGQSLIMGHVHTRRDSHEAGFSLGIEDYGKLAEPVDHLYDEEAVALGFALGTEKKWVEASPESEAVCWIEGHVNDPITSSLPMPHQMRINPLLETTRLRWPSRQWRDEYLHDARSLGSRGIESFALTEQAVLLLLADGAEQINSLPLTECERLYRMRVLTEQPPRW